MTPPMPLRDFQRLLRQYGCYLDKTSKEWCVRNHEGKFVCSIAVRHGKEEVKPVYVKQFLKAIGKQGID